MHRGRNKMAGILPTASNAFSWTRRFHFHHNFIETCSVGSNWQYYVTMLFPVISFTPSGDFRSLTVISDDLRVISNVLWSCHEKKNMVEETEWIMGAVRNGVRPCGFVFHRNDSLSFVISGIQIHSGGLRSARRPWWILYVLPANRRKPFPEPMLIMKYDATWVQVSGLTAGAHFKR